MIARVLLYIRTVSHLRPSQVAYRLLRRVQRLRPPRIQKPAVRPRPEGIEAVRAAVEARGPGASEDRVARAQRVRDGRLAFLNEERSLDEIDWRGVTVSPLWTYNLHYFDYALDLAWAHRATEQRGYAKAFETRVTEWIALWDRARGPAWDAYPTSLRIVNWISALALFGDAITPAVRTKIWQSIAGQARHLALRLERDVLGNHYHKNLKALLLAGLVLDDPHSADVGDVENAHWQELFDQVNADGGHVERSPMYHAIALVDFLEVRAVVGLLDREVPEGVDRRLRRMVDALAFLSRPDGSLHLFNDAANCVAPGNTEITGLARLALECGLSTASGLSPLTETGFYGVIRESGTRLLIDAGKPSPEHQPGHSHNGILSYELDIRGWPLVVDSGVCGYDGDPHRAYCRSTAAHNTVMVGEGEQNEVWGTFRIGRRARLRSSEQRRSEGAYEFEGAYSPFYSRETVHHRWIQLGRTWLHVKDTVHAPAVAQITSFVHFHPAVDLDRDGNGFRIRAQDGTYMMEVARTASASLQTGWYCAEFGRPVRAPVVVIRSNPAKVVGLEYTLAFTGCVARLCGSERS